MKLQSLLKPGQPNQHLLILATNDAYDALRALGHDPKNNCSVRFLRGSKCADRAGFFDEAAAALQLGPHFGENWDAFHDSLSELPNIHSETVILVVLEAGSFLESPKDALTNFQTVVKEVVAEWAKPAAGKPVRNLHIVYQAETDKILGTKLPGLVKLA
ncbi:barstar family protein [Telmatocola sphagniphila]|jgi:hypothetical protein|uniref:Barstar family protein n=1 Tax=Telmatocola sphagniphila TaxID=1123043 RepID=A0A8E6EY58_9BACT|nr:barstar family protein [Telmatocola sphagniphila]QVL32036.1 barstar family protein [Telmatocola sphagniphila]